MDSLFKNLQKKTLERIEKGEFITGDKNLLNEELSRYRGDWMDEAGFVDTGKPSDVAKETPKIDNLNGNSLPVKSKEKVEVVVTEYDLFDKLRNTQPSDYKNMMVLLLELYFMGELDRISVLRVPKNTLMNMQNVLKEFPEMLNAILKGE